MGGEVSVVPLQEFLEVNPDLSAADIADIQGGRPLDLGGGAAPRVLVAPATEKLILYGDWGCELHSTASTPEEAKKKAQAASARNPENEYCVEIDPGCPDNPLYRGGQQIGGHS